MYSEQLEQLIKSVIADGVITEKERAVLHKKAASEGVDEDEIDVYVDGLVAQMKPQKEDVGKSNIDLSNNTELMKILNKDCTYYINACPFEFSANYLKKIGINYLYIVDNGKGAVLELGILLYGIGKRLYHDPQLLFETDKGRLELSKNHEYERVLKEPIESSKTRESFYTAYRIDKDLLRFICDSKTVSLSLLGMEDYNSRKLHNEENINISNIAEYSQVFYRSVVDNNAYPNATIKQNDSIADEKETDADSETLKVLTIPKKVMNKVALRHKYFEQFAVKNSDVQFIEFDEKYSLSSFNSYIKVFSILKDEKQQFFLKVIYNYYEEKKNRKGEVEQEKKVMNLNAGSMKIVCDGYTEVKLSPLAKSKAIFDKDSEMNFYPISEQDLRTILEAENVSINLYGKKLKAEDIKHVGFSSKLPFVWKQALATLMGEEVPEKKTLFGKIKGMFK